MTLEEIKECLGPKWASVGGQALAWEIIDRLESSMKRERALDRKIKKMGKPHTCPPCRNCRDRERYARYVKKVHSKARACNQAECRKVIESIEESWPGFKRIPTRMWNMYLDTTAICRCGRPVAPRIVNASRTAAHCSDECSEKNYRDNQFKKIKQRIEERKSLAEAL
jgi:hypothetical protein